MKIFDEIQKDYKIKKISSISYLQRKFKLSYREACVMMNKLALSAKYVDKIDEQVLRVYDNLKDFPSFIDKLEI